LWDAPSRRALTAPLVWALAVLAYSLAVQVLLEELGLPTAEPLSAQLQLLSLALVLSLPLVVGVFAGLGPLSRVGGLPRLARGMVSGVLAGAVVLGGFVLVFFGLAALVLIVLPGRSPDEYLTPPEALAVVLLSIPLGGAIGAVGGLVGGLLDSIGGRGSRAGGS
jgi:hypothetical protein